LIRVVIYDDHPQRSESLRILLSRTEGMECVGTFPDCSQVEQDMEALHPDVVLMDIEMPKVNGIDGVSKIKRTYPEVRVIMQTVFEDEARIFASLQAGADGYILKNAHTNKIIDSIFEVYRGGASMTPSVAMKVIRYFNQKPPLETLESNLTPKEKEVLSLLAEGNSYKMVADKLGISFFTVNTHVKRIYEKLHVHSLSEALSLSMKKKIF
jgi:DNA-binding NarL/FixJ family response regulator